MSLRAVVPPVMQPFMGLVDRRFILAGAAV